MMATMRVMARCLLAVAVAIGGCSDDPAPATVDASVTADLGVDAPATDTPAATDVPATCDVGAPPVATSALPAIRGTMVIVGGDGGTTPTPSGGDPAGRWVMSTATMYWPSIASGQLRPEGGAIEGTGWVVIEGASYRLATDLVLRVDSTAAGVVVRPSMLASRGTFTAATGGALALTPECATSNGMTPGNSLGFSRDSAERARLFVALAGAAGTATIVFDLQRVP